MASGTWCAALCVPSHELPPSAHTQATRRILPQVDDKQAVQLARETARLVPAAVAADSHSARAKAVADSLLQRALQLGSADNITVLVLWLIWP